jgi:hypothetical protein
MESEVCGGVVMTIFNGLVMVMILFIVGVLFTGFICMAFQRIPL